MIALWSALAFAGSLEGVVRDEQGEPAGFALVVAYDRRLGFTSQQVGADGVFRFDALADGPWRLRVIPYGLDPLAEEWAHDTLSVCESAVFEVGPDPLSPVEVVLGPGASVGGVIVDPQGAPVKGAVVLARPVDAPAAYLRGASTGDDGSFSVEGLTTFPDGTATYRLEIDEEGFPVQQFGGGYLPAEATPVDVARGARTEVGTHALLAGIHVAGTATGPDGEPVDGQVRVYSGTQVVQGLVAQGTWAVGELPPGQVLPWVRAGGYGTTWWPDADRPGERISVTAEGAEVDDVDIVLPRQSRLRGRLVGPLATSGIGVLAYNDDQTVGVGAVADPDGSFAVDALHGGTYTLFVFGSSAGFLDDFARGQGGAPIVFEVPDEADSPVTDVMLGPAASLSGTVRDRVTGAPVYGASVHAVGQATGGEKVVSTAADGTWRLVGLPRDAWAVWVDYQPYCAGDPGWAPIHHPDRVNPALVEVIPLDPGDAVTWDALLPPDHDHDGMDDGWESDNGLDPTRDDALEDADGDGFANLEEYVLGTDPSADAAAEEGCGGCSGGRSLLPFAILPWWRRRRLG